MTDALATDAVAAFRTAERTLFARYGLVPRERMLTIQGRPLRVVEVGGGPPVLFVHGGGGCGALWAPLVAELAGRTAILIDRPGFGLSAEVPLEGVDFRRHAVSVLEDVLDALHLGAQPEARIDIVANSMGGLWSLWLALDRPTRVASLSLLGTPALTGGTGVPLPMRLLGRGVIGPLMARMEPPSPAQVRTLWQRMGHDPGALCDELHAALEALERLPSYDPAWRGLLRRVTTLGGVRPDVVLHDRELEAVQCPTALVWGTNDPFGPVTVGEAIAKRLRAPFVVAGQGHLPWLDDPRACAAGLLVKPGRQAAA